jgi:sugar phosphate isomerase/epimerase
MKYGFVAFYDEVTAKFAAQAGFDGIEIFVGPIMDIGMGLDIVALHDDEIKRIMDFLGSLAIGMTTLSCNPIHLLADPVKREEGNRHFRKALESAKQMGTDIVVTNVFTDKTQTLAQNLALYKKVFGEYAKIAENAGVKIALENCPHWSGTPPVIGNLAYSPEMWDALFEAVPSEAIGLEFDPSHLVWQGIDYLRAIKEYAGRIYAFHAKDTEMLPEEQYRYGIFGQQINAPSDWPGGWWRYRIPGFGQVNWKAIQNALYEMEYTGSMIIEHEDPVFGGDRSENGLGLGSRTEMGLKLGLAHLKEMKLI